MRKVNEATIETLTWIDDTCLCMASHSVSCGMCWWNRKNNNKEKKSRWYFWRLTCRWCRTCRSASGCSFPAAFVAPWSGQQVGDPESTDAYSPETRWRGSCTPDCSPERDSLNRETHDSQTMHEPQLCICLMRFSWRNDQYTGNQINLNEPNLSKLTIIFCLVGNKHPFSF